MTRGRSLRITASSWLRRIDIVVTRLERVSIVILLFVSVGVLILDIVLRNFFGMALAWAAELTRYAIVWLVFIASSVGARTGAHISIDLFSEILPPRMAQWILRLAALIAAATTLALAWLALDLVFLMRGLHQTSPSLLLPMWAVYLAMPLGFFLMTVRFIQHLLFLSVDDKRSNLAQASS